MPSNNEPEYDSFESFDEFFKQAEKRLSYWVERAELEYTEEVVARMQELGVTKARAKRKD
jgi:hypothetical protein